MAAQAPSRALTTGPYPDAKFLTAVQQQYKCLTELTMTEKRKVAN